MEGYAPQTVNIFFNMLSLGIGAYGTHAELYGRHWTIMQNCNRLSCICGIVYFTYDIYLEGIRKKRMAFIPHHVLSLIISYKYYMLTDIPMIRKGPLLLLGSEGSGFLVNVREVLKQRNQLTTRIDTCLLIVYIILRNGVVTPIVYNNRINNPTIWYGWLGIFAMSNIWGCMWANSIIKYRRKTNKSN